MMRQMGRAISGRHGHGRPHGRPMAVGPPVQRAARAGRCRARSARGSGRRRGSAVAAGAAGAGRCWRCWRCGAGGARRGGAAAGVAGRMDC